MLCHLRFYLGHLSPAPTLKRRSKGKEGVELPFRIILPKYGLLETVEHCFFQRIQNRGSFKLVAALSVTIWALFFFIQSSRARESNHDFLVAMPEHISDRELAVLDAMLRTRVGRHMCFYKGPYSAHTVPILFPYSAHWKNTQCPYIHD